MKYAKEEVLKLIEQLRIGQKITLCYQSGRKKKYLTYTGKVTKINNNLKYLVLGEITVGYAEIDILTIP